MAPLPGPRPTRRPRRSILGLFAWLIVLVCIILLAIVIYFALRGQFPIGDPVLPTQSILPSATDTPTVTITNTPTATITSTVDINSLITARPSTTPLITLTPTTDIGQGGGGEDPTPTQEGSIYLTLTILPQATNATLIPWATPTMIVIGLSPSPIPIYTSTSIIYPTFSPTATTFVPTVIPTTVFVPTQRAAWDWRNSKDGSNCNIGSNINNSTSGQIFFTNTRSSTVYLVEMDFSGAVIAKEIQQPIEPNESLFFYEPLGKNYAVTSDPQGTQKLMFNVTDSNNEAMGSYCVVGIHPDYPANANINVTIP